MKRIFNLLTGAGLGAIVAFFWDPDIGRRRRSLLRDQLIHAITQFRRGIDTTGRDLRNRAYGTVAELRGSITGTDGSDDILVNRVRSKMGRYVSHPASIEVTSHNGVVTLRGAVLANEVERLLHAIKSVRGVRGVDNQLEVHGSAGNLSGLQGGVQRTGEPADWSQQNWSPAARLIAGAAGSLLVVKGAARRTASSPLWGAAGAALVLRALTNTQLGRLLGLGSGASQGESGRATCGQSQHSASSTRAANDEQSAIDEAGEESFPASDAPSYSRTTGARNPAPGTRRSRS